jgi:protein SCO1/2
MKKLAPFILSLVIVTVAIVGLWQFMPAAGITETSTGKASTQSKTTEGSAAIGGAFTLTNTEGQTVTEQDLLGNWSLVYFGFTYCPDICPTTLLSMSQALDGLGQLSDRVTPVFITVDPARDTVDVMKAYAENFHPRLIALTGTQEQTDKAAKAYKVFYKLQKEEGNADYLVDHSGFAYLMNPQGQYVTHFTHSDNAETMMTILTKYIR